MPFSCKGIVLASGIVRSALHVTAYHVIVWSPIDSCCSIVSSLALIQTGPDNISISRVVRRALCGAYLQLRQAPGWCRMYAHSHWRCSDQTGTDHVIEYCRYDTHRPLTDGYELPIETARNHSLEDEQRLGDRIGEQTLPS